MISSPDAPETSFPWPPPEGGSTLESLVETWRQSLFQPSSFFSAMPTPARVGPAIVYYLIVGVAASGVNLFWQMVFQITPGLGRLSTGSGPSLLGGWEPLISFFFSPIYLLIGLGISFIITHLLLLLFGGAKRGASTTFRVLSFSYGPAIFAIVPFVGSMVGGIWTIVLAVIGLREAHQTDTWRVVLAVLFPLIAIVVLVTIVTLVVGTVAALLVL